MVTESKWIFIYLSQGQCYIQVSAVFINDILLLERLYPTHIVKLNNLIVLNDRFAADVKQKHAN